MGALDGKVAVVAGATRGAGRGIARALGEAGATVYCTGRSLRGEPSHYGRPETLEETVEQIAAAGGRAVALPCDHRVEAQVAGALDRVIGETDRLDVVALCVAGEDPDLGTWGKLVDTDLSRGAAALENALLTHLITAKHAARHMTQRKCGLIVEVTDGDMLGGGGNLLSGLVKTARPILAYHLAQELRPDGVAALAISPGFLRSERMLEHFGVTEANWRDAAEQDPNYLESETPLFVGRAVAALAADPDVMEHTGELTSSWEVARRHGFTDEDGRRPDWGRHFLEIAPSIDWFQESLPPFVAWLETLAERARRCQAPPD